MKNFLVSLCAYNIWANKRILEYLHLQPADLIDRETISSYSTIRKTVYHMWDAQLIWLNRLQGISLSSWPSAEYDEHFTGFDIYYLQQSEDFKRFVETHKLAPNCP